MSKSGYAMLGLLTQIGLNVVLTVGASSWAGHVVDRRFGTGPYLTLLGVILGVAAAYWNTYKLVASFFGPDRKGGNNTQ